MLIRNSGKNWLRGFYPIFRKELFRKFSNKRWIPSLVTWISISAIPTISLVAGGDSTPSLDKGIGVISLFLWLGTAPMSIGTIVISQGAIVEEKLTQTLLWIFSKPLSGSAFILAKFTAYAVFIAVMMLGIPAFMIAITAVVLGISTGFLLSYFAGIAMIYLLLLFILALNLMLGTIFEKISFVSATAFVVYIAGGSLNVNQYLRKIEPYSYAALQRYAVETATGNFPILALTSIATTVLLIAIFLFIASWKMKRYEF